MSEHLPHSIERHCDVCVVGGSTAGLAAALQLGRQRRSVIVVDAGEPRNAPADHMHSFLGYEGRPPAELLSAGRGEVRSYGVEMLDGSALVVHRIDDGSFRVELAGGHAIVARRVLAATGIVDELPEIEGLAEHWGRGVIHCPFCHGFEVRDQRVVLILTHPMGLHPAALFRQLTDQLTIVVHDPAGVDEGQLDLLAASGVEVRHACASRVLTGADGRLTAVELADQDRIDANAVVIGPRFRARAEPFAPLDLRPVAHAAGLGDFIETDALGATAVPGVYAAGNVTDPSQQVLQAAASGSWVGAMISFSLAHDDLQAANRASGNQADWDHRYGVGQIWSGNPNGTLVNEITGLTPGTALDVGCGEGADALWLAEHGWRVTASDISGRALERVAAEADRRSLAVESVLADANAPSPFGARRFDLVSAQYPAILRTPDRRGLLNLLAAVGPDGTLLVVHHDLQSAQTPIDPHTEARPFDAHAYLSVEDFANAVAASAEWNIEVHEKRPRPAGAATTQHVDDVVLRARRR